MSDSEEEKRGVGSGQNGWIIPNGCEYGRENHKALAEDGPQQKGLA